MISDVSGMLIGPSITAALFLASGVNDEEGLMIVVVGKGQVATAHPNGRSVNMCHDMSDHCFHIPRRRIKVERRIAVLPRPAGRISQCGEAHFTRGLLDHSGSRLPVWVLWALSAPVTELHADGTGWTFIISSRESGLGGWDW